MSHPALPVRFLATALVAGFAASETPAQNVSSSVPVTSVSSTPSSAASDRMNPNDSLGPSGRSPMDMQRLSPGVPSAEAPGPFFLPPVLPVLDPKASALAQSVVADYPRECAGEPFFMAYGNLTANRELSQARVERIARYLANRTILLAELRELLDREAGAAAPVRAQAVADLAAHQAERLADLEAEAEQIRRNLTQVELLSARADDIGRFVDANGAREFKAEHALMRQFLSAAHFQAGFSRAQRQLLEEMAQEIQLFIESGRSASRVAVFFWPAGARIPTPKGLSPAAAADFEEFQRRKEALKGELVALLKHENSHVFNRDFSDDHADLAAAQAARFAELDVLADRIRPALASRVVAKANPAAELPAAVAEQVMRLARYKAALQNELNEQVAEFRRQLPGDRVELASPTGVPAITVASTGGSTPEREAVLTRVSAFNTALALRFADYAAEHQAVNAALARHQAAAPGTKSPRSLDQLAADLQTAQRAREERNRQSNYEAAVLEPGLSPGQRRLLLTAVVADSVQAPSQPSFLLGLAPAP